MESRLMAIRTGWLRFPPSIGHIGNAVNLHFERMKLCRLSVSCSFLSLFATNLGWICRSDDLSCGWPRSSSYLYAASRKVRPGTALAVHDWAFCQARSNTVRSDTYIATDTVDQTAALGLWRSVPVALVRKEGLPACSGAACSRGHSFESIVIVINFIITLQTHIC